MMAPSRRASAGVSVSEPEKVSRGSRASLAHAYPVAWRIAAALLVATSRASVPLLALATAFNQAEPYSLRTLLAALAAYALLPGVAAWLLERAFAAVVELRERALHVRGRGVRLEIPCASIERIHVWRVPLPGPGLAFELRSGARLEPGLATRDPVPLLRALAGEGGVAAAAEALHHPLVAFAHARSSRARGLPANPWLKFPLFALLPAAVLFNAHQHIAYGGTLGQYHLEGLRAYLATLAFYYGIVCVYLVFFASLLRTLAELGALLAARLAPGRAARVRGAAELACTALYYAGVPAFLLARFLL
jgi:apolipoprotein N-acyltransferase